MAAVTTSPDTTRVARRPERSFADHASLPVTGFCLAAVALAGLGLAGAGALGRRLLRA